MPGGPLGLELAAEATAKGLKPGAVNDMDEAIEFTTGLRWADVPAHVRRRLRHLLVDFAAVSFIVERHATALTTGELQAKTALGAALNLTMAAAVPGRASKSPRTRRGSAATASGSTA